MKEILTCYNSAGQISQHRTDAIYFHLHKVLNHYITETEGRMGCGELKEGQELGV